MTVYKVRYYTLGKGKCPDGKIGNLKISTEIAYIQCRNTSCVEVILEKYHESPNKHGNYYSAVVETITAVSGFCLIE